MKKPIGYGAIAWNLRGGGDQWETAEALGHLAMIAWEQGRYDEAKRLIEKNLVIQQALGNQSGIGDMYSTRPG